MNGNSETPPSDNAPKPDRYLIRQGKHRDMAISMYKTLTGTDPTPEQLKEMDKMSDS